MYLFSNYNPSPVQADAILTALAWSNFTIFFSSDSVQNDEQFHQEFKPPPEGSATGIGKQEQVIPVADQAHDQEQIQHRSVFPPLFTRQRKLYG